MRRWPFIIARQPILAEAIWEPNAMGLRTAEQYKESLRDGRSVYFRGERVHDVTTHPVIGVAVEHACIDYRMAEDPRYQDLAVVTDPQGGEPYSRYYHLPRNAEDLLQRS